MDGLCLAVPRTCYPIISFPPRLDVCRELIASLSADKRFVLHTLYRNFDERKGGDTQANATFLMGGFSFLDGGGA